MRIKSSQVRALVLLFPKEKQEWATSSLKPIFPEAFAWTKISSDNLHLVPYKFANDELGVEIFDYIYQSDSTSTAAPRRVGVWRPGKGEQEFDCGEYFYRVMEAGRDGSFSVWRCAE